MSSDIILPWLHAASQGGWRHSMQSFAGNGTPGPWAFSFAGDYLDTAHVKAYRYDPATAASHPQSLTFIGPNTVTTGEIIPAGQFVVIYRDTPKGTPLVDYATGAVMSEANLDTSNRQAVFAAAEVVDRLEAAHVSNSDAAERSVLALATANTALDKSAAAVTTADAATATANAAHSAAGAATSTANTASAAANSAVSTANAAMVSANAAGVASAQAVTTANAASAAASNAVATANAASTAAGNAVTIANSAEAQASTAATTANAASAAAANAVATADSAATTANGIDAKAQSALDNSTAAVSTANAATATATTAAAVASGIDGKAQTALDAANSAVTTANAAAAAASGVDTKATQAQTDAAAALVAANSAASSVAGKADLNHNHDAAYAAKTHHHDGAYAGASHTHGMGGITDATATGKAVLAAPDAAAARAAIGAGTGNSNLTIGTTATTAKAGNWTPDINSETTGQLPWSRLSDVPGSGTNGNLPQALGVGSYTLAEKNVPGEIGAGATVAGSALRPPVIHYEEYDYLYVFIRTNARSSLPGTWRNMAGGGYGGSLSLYLRIA